MELGEVAEGEVEEGHQHEVNGQGKFHFGEVGEEGGDLAREEGVDDEGHHEDEGVDFGGLFWFLDGGQVQFVHLLRSRS